MALERSVEIVQENGVRALKAVIPFGEARLTKKGDSVLLFYDAVSVNGGLTGPETKRDYPARVAITITCPKGAMSARDFDAIKSQVA